MPWPTRTSSTSRRSTCRENSRNRTGSTEHRAPITAHLLRWRPNLAPFGPDHRHEGDALAGRAAQVVGEGQLAAAGDAGDLALAGLAAELEPRLEEHAQAGGADRVTEGLEPAVRIHGQLALEVEGPVEHFLPPGAARRETQILHQHQLGGREAVVHL